MPPKTTELYACGFNAHGQLEFETGSNNEEDDGRKLDVFEFRRIAGVQAESRSKGVDGSCEGFGEVGVGVVWAGWSQSVGK